MALELNGTTGVSLVQDGVVTAADLASGAITSAALPLGSVLQMVSNDNTTSITHSNTGYTDVVSLSITPTTSGNKLYIIGDVNFLIINTNQSAYYPYGQYRFDIGGSATSVFQIYGNRFDADERQSHQNTMTHFHTVTSGQAGTSITVKVEGRREASNPTTFMSNPYSPSRLTVIEVAQ